MFFNYRRWKGNAGSIRKIHRMSKLRWNAVGPRFLIRLARFTRKNARKTRRSWRNVASQGKRKHEPDSYYLLSLLFFLSFSFFPRSVHHPVSYTETIVKTVKFRQILRTMFFSLFLSNIKRWSKRNWKLENCSLTLKFKREN